MQIKDETPTPPRSPTKSKAADIQQKTPVKTPRSLPAKSPRRQDQAGSPVVVGVHPIPSPADLQMPREGQDIQGFYLVTVGRECGLFFSWDDSHDRTNGVSGACHKRYKTWQQAVERYRDAYKFGRVKAIPEPGSKYWTTPVSVAFSRARFSRPSASSDELYWDRLEEDEQGLKADELSAHFGAIDLQDW